VSLSADIQEKNLQGLTGWAQWGSFDMTRVASTSGVVNMQIPYIILHFDYTV
jgi:hypothetical protein